MYRYDRSDFPPKKKKKKTTITITIIIFLQLKTDDRTYQEGMSLLVDLNIIPGLQWSLLPSPGTTGEGP